jgi:ornithine cyclodeaminase
MKILTQEALAELVKKHGFENFLTDLMRELKVDFARWQEFDKIPRPAMHVPGGVLELMPICDSKYYTYKYVNCHPKNPEGGLMTVVATGQISRVDTGYPLMASEMTILTALRTAATTAVATDLMSRADSRVLAIVGTGAQSEFLVRATLLVRDITEVRYFDTDPKAMDKFEKNTKNIKSGSFALTRCGSVEEATVGADVITVCTACRANVDVIKDVWVRPGVHINGIGGDSVGKTELEFPILERSRIVVEYFDQSVIEGEIQRFKNGDSKEAIEKVRDHVHAELYEVITGAKSGRESEEDITLYDSTGIALEDYTALRYVYELTEKYGLGQELNLTPTMSDPKNLISVLN